MSGDKPMDEQQLNSMSSQALAFVGDAVYSLLVCEHLAREYPERRNLHNLSVADVNCKAQSTTAEQLIPHLTEQELAVYKRGRNNTASTAPKNADVADYRRATGVEALFGWLYLSGDIKRVEELFSVAAETLI